MLYTFHHIFSLPRGWLCCTLITSQGKRGKQWSNAHHRYLSWKRAFNKNLQAPFLSGLCRHFQSFVDIFTLIQQTTRSSRWRSTELAKSVLCLLFATKTKCSARPSAPKFSLLPSPSRPVSAPWTATQRSRFMSKFEVSLEQCPCFGAQRDTPSLQ